MKRLMIEERNNPWAKINLASSKRIEIETPYSFHWIKDDKDRSGLRINFNDIPTDNDAIPKINGITTVIRRHQTCADEFFLLVMNPADQDIFFSLCLDLINTSLNAKNEIILYRTITNRLRHWQRFLSLGSAKTMPEPLQMGLYAELSFLNNSILTIAENSQAVSAWVGPDFDKQDFSFEFFLVEIKSFITSKGPFINISSMYQLLYNSKPLYLVAFGISRNNGGRSILELIEDIRQKLSGDILLLNIFDEKLSQYGYFEGITEEPFFKYSTDSTTSYFVSSDFPKITPAVVSDKITTVQYTIDLSKCQVFEARLPTLNNNL